MHFVLGLFTIIAMKSALVVLALIGTATALKSKDPDPAAIARDQEFRAEDSFGNTALTPPCDKISCGEYSCPTPFELKVDNTCCGYCWAPDHVVPADRHAVVAVNATGLVVDQCESAPSFCKGPGSNAVRCFQPNCREGAKPHCAPGSCCAACSAV